MDHAIKIIKDNGGGRAQRPHLLIRRVQGAIDVGALKDHLHLRRHTAHPNLRVIGFVELGVKRRQSKPGAGRTRHAGHHAASEGTQCSRTRVVKNLVVALLTLVVLAHKEAAGRGSNTLLISSQWSIHEERSDLSACHRVRQRVCRFSVI